MKRPPLDERGKGYHQGWREGFTTGRRMGMTRALIGNEGGVPPILLWSRGGPWGWGLYLRTRRWYVTAGPMYGWCARAAGAGDDG